MTIGDTRDSKPELYGVGGWLAFLCITLLVLTPIGVVVEVIVTLRAPDMELLDKGIGIGLVIALGAFAVFAGISLLRIRPYAVRIAKAYLFVTLSFWILMAAFALLVPEVTEGLSPAEIARPIIVSTAWLAYLYRSERVANTYSGSRVNREEAADVFK
jgi:hypothetical protein